MLAAAPSSHILLTWPLSEGPAVPLSSELPLPWLWGEPSCAPPLLGLELLGVPGGSSETGASFAQLTVNHSAAIHFQELSHSS